MRHLRIVPDDHRSKQGTRNLAHPTKASEYHEGGSHQSDFLQSDEARQIAVDNGYPPVGEGETPSTDNQLLGQVLTAYEGLVKTGNTTDYINNATAGMQASAIIPGFQSLIDGTMTPKAFVESIQAQYEKEAK